MLPFAYYILKVITCSIILHGYYLLFLRNKVFHSYNRFYLLSLIALSITLPLVTFNLPQQTSENPATVVKMLRVVNTSDQFMDEVIIQARYKSISGETIAWWLFAVVCLILLFRFTRSILDIYSLKKKNPHYFFEGIGLINTNDSRTPFSFLRNIFWNDAIDINTENGKRILKHEVAHVQENHTYDKLFMNIVLIIFWCNPVFWLIRKELSMIHEFIADKKAIDDGNTAAFAGMILLAAYPNKQFELTNNFFYSPLKRRLTMITKNKTSVGYISRLLALFLTIIVFAAFTLKAKKSSSIHSINKIITVVIDAGHGGADEGAFDDINMLEKDLTLAYAKAVKSYNKDEKVKIILTREADINQTPQERSAYANKINPDLFISIHFNSTADKKKEPNSGMSVLVSRQEFANAAKSKIFASAIINSFTNNYNLPVPANPMQQKAGIRVLQEVKCPAVLIEAGYMSNEKDMHYLNSESGKEQFAKNILRAIINFAENMNQPSTTIQNKDIDKTNERSPVYLLFREKQIILSKKGEMVINPNSSVKVDDLSSLKTLLEMPADKDGNLPLYFVNGKEIEQHIVKTLSLNSINYAVIFLPTGAISKHGVKGKYAAIEIMLKGSGISPEDDC